MVAGWPGRVGRNGFGAFDMQDERLSEDPTRYVQAYQLNLQWWQVGAMGLIAPKFVIGIDTTSEPRVLYGAFAWDQTLYVDTASFPSYLSYDQNAPGDYVFTFSSPVTGRPDENGVPQSEVLSMQFGLADANDTITGRLQTEVTVSGGGLVFNVTVRPPGGALVAPDSIVLAGF